MKKENGQFKKKLLLYNNTGISPLIKLPESWNLNYIQRCSVKTYSPASHIIENN